jgi:hypothetical protein
MVAKIEDISIAKCITKVRIASNSTTNSISLSINVTKVKHKV